MKLSTLLFVIYAFVLSAFSLSLAAAPVRLVHLSTTYDEGYKEVARQIVDFTVEVEDKDEDKMVSLYARDYDGKWRHNYAHYLQDSKPGYELWYGRLEYLYNDEVSTLDSEHYNYVHDIESVVRLKVNGKNYWDNNNGANYKLIKNGGAYLHPDYDYLIQPSYIDNKVRFKFYTRFSSKAENAYVILSKDNWESKKGVELYEAGEDAPSPFNTLQWQRFTTLSAGESIEFAVKYKENGQYAWYNNNRENYTYSPNEHKNTEQVYLRAKSINWGKQAMTFIGDHYWYIDFEASDSDYFKFDLSGDWDVNYGDNNNDGMGDWYGEKIPIKSAGKYRIRFDDSAKSYQLFKLTNIKSEHSLLYLRGTFNDWKMLRMQKVTDNLWTANAIFARKDNPRFKFDVHGDWSINYGRSGQSGYAERSGPSINIDDGYQYQIYFNDKTLEYRTVKRFQTNFPSLYHRFKFNDWQTQPMMLIADYTWAGTTWIYPGKVPFKFDVYGDWRHNYGDDDNDGHAERSGDNIVKSVEIPIGSYVEVQAIVWFDDSTKNYQFIDWPRR